MTFARISSFSRIITSLTISVFPWKSEEVETRTQLINLANSHKLNHLLVFVDVEDLNLVDQIIVQSYIKGPNVCSIQNNVHVPQCWPLSIDARNEFS